MFIKNHLIVFLLLLPACMSCKRTGNEIAVAPVTDFVYNGDKTVFSDIRFISNGKGHKLSWNLGDGTVTTTESPVHYYRKPGTYKVMLTVDNMAADTIVKNITVRLGLERMKGLRSYNCTGWVKDTEFNFDSSYNTEYTGDIYVNDSTLKFQYEDVYLDEKAYLCGDRTIIFTHQHLPWGYDSFLYNVVTGQVIYANEHYATFLHPNHTESSLVRYQSK